MRPQVVFSFNASVLGSISGFVFSLSACMIVYVLISIKKCLSVFIIGHSVSHTVRDVLN